MPVVQEANKLIRRGAIGKVLLVRSQTVSLPAASGTRVQMQLVRAQVETRGAVNWIDTGSTRAIA